MKHSVCVIATAAVLTVGAGWSVGAVQAAPISAQGTNAALQSQSAIEPVLYRWAGREYCWYDDGWRGPGWYWCGYSFRQGLGWGGPAGWHGWRTGAVIRERGIERRGARVGVEERGIERRGRVGVEERGRAGTEGRARVGTEGRARVGTEGRSAVEGRGRVEGGTTGRSERSGGANVQGGGNAQGGGGSPIGGFGNTTK